jgi:3-keto-disaccharide hydrolase
MKLFAAVPVLLALALPAVADDWVKLFNGKDLAGWKIPPKTNNDFTEIIPVKSDGGAITGYDAKLKDGKTVHIWRVEDGILIGSGPHSHLFSEGGGYTDFEYKVVAMINDHGNSGQYFRAKFEGGFPRGYEAQIDATHGDPIRTGSLYPDGRTKLGKYRKQICVMNTAPHKPNEWFTQQVTAKGNHITIKVNGKVTVDFTDPESTYTKGHFALQGHDPGTVVKFKSIEIRELK